MTGIRRRDWAKSTQRRHSQRPISTPALRPKRTNGECITDRPQLADFAATGSERCRWVDVGSLTVIKKHFTKHKERPGSSLNAARHRFPCQPIYINQSCDNEVTVNDASHNVHQHHLTQSRRQDGQDRSLGGALLDSSVRTYTNQTSRIRSSFLDT